MPALGQGPGGLVGTQVRAATIELTARVDNHLALVLPDQANQLSFGLWRAAADAGACGRPCISWAHARLFPSEAGFNRGALLRSFASVPAGGAPRRRHIAVDLALDIDPPARQPRRQPGVLAILADRQGEVRRRHHHGNGAGLDIDVDRVDLGRSKRVCNQLVGLIRPLHDVHPLARQLLADGMVAGPLGADARPHRVETVLGRLDRDLGAQPGFAGQALDHHRAAEDLGDLELKQAFYQAAIGARNYLVRTPLADPGLQPRALQPLPRVVALLGNLLFRRQDRP